MKHDAMVELLRKDHSAYLLVCEAFFLLDSLYPIDRGMCPAGRDRYGLTAEPGKLRRTVRELQDVCEAAHNKWNCP